MADIIWVVAREPLECTSIALARKVADLIGSRNKHYVYWTPDRGLPSVLSFVRKLTDIHDLSGDLVAKHVEVIRVPVELGIFAVALYFEHGELVPFAGRHAQRAPQGAALDSRDAEYDVVRPLDPDEVRELNELLQMAYTSISNPGALQRPGYDRVFPRVHPPHASAVSDHEN